jgi:mono/diheme cytochrome c family protein
MIRILLPLWILVPLFAETPAPRFEKDVLPVFTQYCFTCHGQSSPKLGLDLRTAASALKGSHNGPVIVKGSPDESLLWKMVSTRAMPPSFYNQKMPEAEMEIIRRWIAAGAPFDAPVGAAAQEAAQQRERFERDVAPLLKARCVQCHGETKPAAGLNLATSVGLLKGSVNGPVIVEGFSERSVLIRRISNHTMPPPGTGKPLTEAEARLIKEWIDRGNFSEHVAVDSAERPFSPLEAPPVTEEQRQWWAFRKPVAAAPPKVKAKSRVRTPIDNFVLAKLESKGLSFSPDAPDEKLLRRAFLDLTGLPPSPEEIRQFTEDRAPGAYERLIDRLLNSPRYGERWGRLWLDAAGYVDTTGKDFDPRKAEYAEGMWRYRDYVIRSVNQDKPWNRFLTEQIAGDELADWRKAKTYTPEILDLLAATGYLRNILDITAEDISNLPVERYEALFKLVEKVSSSTLGLTVACARCHSHKFDPISQRDYYRFLALFTTSYNPTDWLKPQDRHLYTVSSEEQERIHAHNKQLDAPIEELNKKLKALRKPYEDRLFEEKLQKLPESIRADTMAAILTPEDKRDDVQKYLFSKFNGQLRAKPEEVEKILSAEDKPEAARLQSEIQALESKKWKIEKIQALWDVGKPPSIRLLQRGSADAPGPRVKPGFFEVLSSGPSNDAVKPPAAKGETSGMRLAFAEWLTNPEHPLTARVIVNRIWQGHFGTGLVATADNFGKMGAPVVNQELLDYLAVDFVSNGWSAKRLHRMIMTSTAYRQSSKIEKPVASDPENTLLWRMNLRRLDAEAVRDSVIAAAGKLDTTQYGPPIELEMRSDGLQVVSSKEPPNAQWRRSVYLTARRTYPIGFLGVFDYPVMDTHCARRTPSATPLQSLTMMNDEFVWKAAEELSRRSGMDVETAYLRTLSRRPAPAELAAAKEFLRAQEDAFLNAKEAPEKAREKAFRSFAQALLSSNEFLYID